MARTGLLRCSGIFFNAGKQTSLTGPMPLVSPVRVRRSVAHATASARRHSQYWSTIMPDPRIRRLKDVDIVKTQYPVCCKQGEF